MPYQTLRFRMQRLKDQGITIAPLLDPEKFGLSRFRVSLDVSPDIPDVTSFFGGMHQNAGLHYFARSLSSHSFDCVFLIPARKVAELARLLKALEEMKLIENPKMRQILWKEILGMKTKYYDYANGIWDVDFSHLTSNPSDYEARTIDPLMVAMPKNKFDHIDLQIIKSLQLDPWTKSVDIARKLNLTDSDISYHMRTHVFGQKMIRGFKFQWIGSKDSWAKHTLFLITYDFKSLSEELARHAMSIFTACPFTWNHMWIEGGEYMAELIIPVAQMPDTIRYLANGLRPLKLKPDEINYVDWSCSLNYTIPYVMHDSEIGWKFDCERSLGFIIQMIKQEAR